MMVINGMKMRAILQFAMLVSFASVFTGCSENRIRNEAQELIRTGSYEDAVRVIEDGLASNPDSIILKSSAIQTKSEAISILIQSAALERSKSNWVEAERLINRALKLDPANFRLRSLLFEVGLDARLSKLEEEAASHLKNERYDLARLLIEQGLKENPRNEGLLALRRKVDLNDRQATQLGKKIALSEIRPISIDFRNGALRTVLDIVGRNSGINFIVDKDVRPDIAVTVLMNQAKVEDVLDLIASTNQLSLKVVDPKTIVVYPNTPEKQKEYQEQVVKVFYLANAEAKSAAAFLKAMLKMNEPFVDDRNNLLSIRDTPANIAMAERLIYLYDNEEPEVQVDVEILEVSRTRLTELGVQFPDTFSLTPLAPDGTSKLTLGNVSGIGRDRISLGISGLIFHLKRQVGDVKTLANPKIRAKNKEKAKILIGDKIPVITSTSSSTGFLSENVNYLDVGIKLDVEPTVHSDDQVGIKVNLEVSSLGSSVKTNSGTLAYQIGTRNATTNLKLRDGETQLLAGLISRDDRVAASRVPGLGDLPILGRLFSNQSDTATHSELVLAITPRIIKNVRKPDLSESELWVGTENAPNLRRYGGSNGQQKVDSAGDGVKIQAPPKADSDRSSPAPAAPNPDAGQPLKNSVGLYDSDSIKVVFGERNHPLVNEEFDIEIHLSSRSALRGLPLQLTYPSRVLTLIGIQEGLFFKKGPSGSNMNHSIDQSEGRVGVVITSNDSAGASGESGLLKLRFKRIGKGDGKVEVVKATPMPASGSLQTAILPTPYILESIE